jgi:hypothetical protein
MKVAKWYCNLKIKYESCKNPKANYFKAYDHFIGYCKITTQNKKCLANENECIYGALWACIVS